MGPSWHPLQEDSVATGSSQGERRKKENIMLVDDEPDIAVIFKSALEREGFHVDTFTDPVKAMTSFQAGRYDLVVLDVRMPAINGVELYRRMRAIDDQVRVCFVTAADQHDFSARFPQLPADITTCFINKPVRINDFLDKIRKALGNK